ncbi:MULTISPECIES: hypothetical protein [unclassified Microcoleus]|uniref:hypothetical protein n=1 Tax=unclassified Microcoleus TaxID=2642155 RepID=UPI002FD2E080
MLQDNRCAIALCREGDRSCSECRSHKLPQLIAQMTVAVEFTLFLDRTLPQSLHTYR